MSSSPTTDRLLQWWLDDADLWAIVVAGGSGNRYGGMKQFEMIGDERVLDLAVAAMGCPKRTVVVLPEDVAGMTLIANAITVAGGATRSASVRAGLAALPETARRVLIHDAARPLASAALVERVIVGLTEADGVVPVVPVTDTLRTLGGEPVDRAAFVAVQTPQGFGVAAIRRAHEGAPDATDDATLVSANGGRVVHVEGDPTNLKITVPTDLIVARALLSGDDPAADDPATGHPANVPADEQSERP